MQKRRGFTLIEILVVIGVISILAAIGIPSYRNYILRGKIAEATSQLSATRVKLEQWFQDNRSYCATAGCPACPASALPDANNAKYFTYSGVDTTCSPTGYTVTAVGVANQGMDSFKYTINQINVKTTAQTPWGVATPVNCWITRQDGSC